MTFQKRYSVLRDVLYLDLDRTLVCNALADFPVACGLDRDGVGTRRLAFDYIMTYYTSVIPKCWKDHT